MNTIAAHAVDIRDAFTAIISTRFPAIEHGEPHVYRDDDEHIKIRWRPVEDGKVGTKECVEIPLSSASTMEGVIDAFTRAFDEKYGTTKA